MSEEKTDKEVYDMSEHLKELYDKKEQELEQFKEQNVELKKVIMTCFGTIRLLDQQWNNILLDPDTNSYLIEALRSYLSSFIEYEILHIEDIL
jgi:hypothetical protein